MFLLKEIHAPMVFPNSYSRRWFGTVSKISILLKKELGISISLFD